MPDDVDLEDVERAVVAVEAVATFACTMRALDVHIAVAADADVRCIVCREPWPCPTSRRRQ